MGDLKMNKIYNEQLAQDVNSLEFKNVVSRKLNFKAEEVEAFASVTKKLIENGIVDEDNFFTEEDKKFDEMSNVNISRYFAFLAHQIAKLNARMYYYEGEIEKFLRNDLILSMKIVADKMEETSSKIFMSGDSLITQEESDNICNFADNMQEYIKKISGNDVRSSLDTVKRQDAKLFGIQFESGRDYSHLQIWDEQ